MTTRQPSRREKGIEVRFPGVIRCRRAALVRAEQLHEGVRAERRGADRRRDARLANRALKRFRQDRQVLRRERRRKPLDPIAETERDEATDAVLAPNARAFRARGHPVGALLGQRNEVGVIPDGRDVDLGVPVGGDEVDRPVPRQLQGRAGERGRTGRGVDDGHDGPVGNWAGRRQGERRVLEITDREENQQRIALLGGPDDRRRFAVGGPPQLALIAAAMSAEPNQHVRGVRSPERSARDDLGRTVEHRDGLRDRVVGGVVVEKSVMGREMDVHRQRRDRRRDRADLDRAFVELAAGLGAVDRRDRLGMRERDPTHVGAQIDGGRGGGEDSIQQHPRGAQRRKARGLLGGRAGSPGRQGRCPGKPHVGRQVRGSEKAQRSCFPTGVGPRQTSDPLTALR